MATSLFSRLKLPLVRINNIIKAEYAAPAKASLGSGVAAKKKHAKVEKIELPVEKDVNKLLTHVCGLNYYKEGEEVPLKPDDQYPEWLWTLRLEPYTLAELDPNTKAYWRYIRKQAIIRNNKRIKHRRL